MTDTPEHIRHNLKHTDLQALDYHFVIHIDGFEVVSGTCSCDLSEKTVGEIQLDEVRVKDLGLKDVPGYAHIFLRAGPALVRRPTISHRIRNPVENHFDVTGV